MLLQYIRITWSSLLKKDDCITQVNSESGCCIQRFNKVFTLQNITQTHFALITAARAGRSVLLPSLKAEEVAHVDVAVYREFGD